MNISEFVVKNHFAETDKFDYSQGFNIAVGLSGWSENVENELPPEIGYIGYGGSLWSINDEGTLVDDWWDFETHTCSREELGLTDDESKAKFFPAKSLQRPYVEKFQKKF